MWLSDPYSWFSAWQAGEADQDGVVQSGNTMAIDYEQAQFRSESDGVELVSIGLKNITSIAMGDAVLVADMSQSQAVEIAVAELKVKQAAQAEKFP